MHDEGSKRVPGDGKEGERNTGMQQGNTCAAAARAACCTSLDSSSARYSWARPTAEAAPKRPARAHMRCSPPLVRAHKRQAVPPGSTCSALRNIYDTHFGSRVDSMQQLQKGILQIHKNNVLLASMDLLVLGL